MYWRFHVLYNFRAGPVGIGPAMSFVFGVCLAKWYLEGLICRRGAGFSVDVGRSGIFPSKMLHYLVRGALTRHLIRVYIAVGCSHHF